ncbi:MAG: hypothetical protein KDA70_09700 [Planctomycetaceae bacterium]|nr:hypothetical protein [Planctomycetaceae bacterium]
MFFNRAKSCCQFFLIMFTLCLWEKNIAESAEQFTSETELVEHYQFTDQGLELNSDSADQLNFDSHNLYRNHPQLAEVENHLSPSAFDQIDLDPVSYHDEEPACVISLESEQTKQLELFLGLEGSKQPQDFGVNAHFGSRLHANYGFQLFEDSTLGFQIGTAVNLTDHAVRVTSQIDGASSRTQSFTTLGFFQRHERISWAVVFDYLYQQDYSKVSLSQLRMQGGYSLNETQEIGAFFMFPTSGANADWAGIPVTLDPLAQGAFYYRQTWDHAAETTFWLGAAEGHGQVNAALGDASDTSVQIAFGSDFHVPLNKHVALFGQANFIMPSDTGTVDAYLGFAIYPGGNAYGWRKQQYSPVLPVANNTSFAVDLDR